MKKLYIFALVAAMFAACATDAVDEQSVKVEELTPDTLVGTFEGDDSRIQLQNGKTVWTEGDEMSVFYRSNANQKWQYQGKTGERSGEIKRVSAPEYTETTTKLVVAYPYNANYYLNHETCNLQAYLPAEQTYQKDSYGLNGNIMVSQSEYKQFVLKSVCGWLKIQLTGNGEKVQSIKLCGNNGEQVAGEIYVNTADATSILAAEMGFSSDNTQVGGALVEDNTILTDVTLNCGKGIELGSEPTAFYIALPPQTFENGVKVIVKTPYNIVEKGSSNSITITRNSILPLKSIDISDFENSGGVEILRTHYEGADISIKVPEHIKQQGRRIKWGIANIAMLEYYGQAPIPAKLHSNDQFYPASLISRDTILNINHHNIYRRNEKGEIGYYYLAGYNPDGTVKCLECSANDPKVATGEAAPVQYYQHFQPGEPLVLMMSEVDYADGNNKHPVIGPWCPGWYWYPYDYAAYQKEAGGNNIDFDKFWHEDAWYKRIELRLPGPEEFTTGDVTVNTSGLKTDGGTITFNPTGDTFAYFAFICPETSAVVGGYMDFLKLVNNDPSLLQWLTTSELAPYLSIFPYYETTIWNLEEILYDVQAGMKYHVIVNAVPGKMVNGDMMIDVSKQKFQHITFKLPEYTLDEPELIVTPYEAYSPYKVKFNVKNPGYATNPVKKVVYAANYTREFSVMFAQDYTYTDLVMMNNGFTDLSEAEVAQVNSAEGYDIEFDVRKNPYFTLAVMGWNMEGRPSNPDKEGSKAVAEARSTDMANATPLDMTKLNALKGDWTATATVKTYDYNTGKTSAAQKSWKVSIGDLKTNNTLSAADYAVFEAAGVNKQAADAYLAQFNEFSANYNASVLGQNRVLCQGWDVSGTRETSTASPWDLFLMPDYNASLVDYLFNDFGPKWFLQTDAQDNIFVPVNYNLVQPMMYWFNGMDHYLCSGNFEKGYANYYNPNDPMDVQSVGIPVEISEDGKTVTLKAVTIDAEGQKIPLYPTMIYDNQGQLAFYNSYVVSEVVLTKGWNGGATPAPAKASSSKKAYGKKIVNNEFFTSPAKTFSRTVFAPTTKKVSEKNATVVTKKVATKEEIRKGMAQLFEKYNRVPRK